MRAAPNGLALKDVCRILLYETRYRTVPRPSGKPEGLVSVLHRKKVKAMSSRVLTPAALALALAFGASLASSPAVAAPHGPQAAATASAAKTLRAYKLSTGMVDGKMVFLDAQGKPNPRLEARVGDTIEITIGSGEGAEHDIVIPELGVQSKHFNASSGPVKVRFEVTRPGTFAYICSVPGHRQIGMEGELVVTGTAAQAAEAAIADGAPIKVRAEASAIGGAARTALPAASTRIVDVVRSPLEVPVAIGQRAPRLVKHRIETVEVDGRLDDGTTFTYWTFGSKVPGPMLRVKQGDTVELTLANAADSKAIHSIDLHAVTGGHGGGADTQVAPGQEKTIRFKALRPGLYVYHCATASIPHHISAGMYGMILVEPPEGLPKVDREFYVMQADLYTTHAKGTKGHQAYDATRADDERPTYFTFNGTVGALTKEHAMTAKVGETIRVYFGVGGPNKVSSFHVIGEIFDTVYRDGSISSPMRDVQTTLVAPGGATIVDLKLDYPGNYLLVDHALSRVGKGLAAAINVSGDADPAVYEVVNGGKKAH
jgi:nitrite reductase (NO-forming)